MRGRTWRARTWQRFGSFTSLLVVSASLCIAADPDDTTPLHGAAHAGDYQKVKALVEAGADPNATNRYGIAPLYLGAQAGSRAVVKVLLKAGADPNHPGPGGETPLMLLATTADPRPVTALVDAGAKVDAPDHRGQTALMRAAAAGSWFGVHALIREGADPKRRLKSGFTPFFFAVREGHQRVVHYFVHKAGIDVNDPMNVERRAGRGPSENYSAMRMALENGHFDLAAYLLQAGAEPNDQRSGVAPLHVLTWVRKPNRGDGIDGLPPPEVFSATDSLRMAELLIEAGADVNLQLKSGGGRLNRKGATPLLMAAKTGDLEYLQLLVKHGADIKRPNVDGVTPLLAACGVGTHAPEEEAGTESECLAVVEYLLALGADINHVDRHKETAMHGAAYANFPKLVHVLAERGADIKKWNVKARPGWTPLLIAQGYRPGNFKPDYSTVEAIEQVMRAAGVEPPPTPVQKRYGNKRGYTP